MPVVPVVVAFGLEGWDADDDDDDDDDDDNDDVSGAAGGAVVVVVVVACLSVGLGLLALVVVGAVVDGRVD